MLSRTKFCRTHRNAMRILIIGGTGFIGKNVTAELAAIGGLTLGVISRSAPEVPVPSVVHLAADRNDSSALRPAIRQFAPDVVVDCILSSGKQARNLVELCSLQSSRVVALSSMDVYRAMGVFHGTDSGPLQPLPLTEDSAIRTPGETYSKETLDRVKSVFSWVDDEYDKVEVEHQLLNQNTAPVTVLRLPMTYGPGDPLHRFAPWLKPMITGEPVIKISGEFANWQSPRGYVVNVAHAVALAAQDGHTAHRVFNVAEEIAFSEIAWATLIAQQVGWTGKFIPVPPEEMPPPVKGNFQQHWIVSSAKIRGSLKFQEVVPADRAIKQTAEWETAELRKS